MSISAYFSMTSCEIQSNESKSPLPNRTIPCNKSEEGVRQPLQITLFAYMLWICCAATSVRLGDGDVPGSPFESVVQPGPTCTVMSAAPCAHAHTHACRSLYYIYIYIYIYTHTYTYIHTHIYTHTWPCIRV